MAPLDWDLLRYVLAISRHGGISAAARALGVNQATVSRQLAKAETEIGQRLFDRLTSGLAATPAGLATVEAAEAMEALHRNLAMELDRRKDRLAGVIRVSLPRYLLNFALLDELAAFKEAYPEIVLNLTTSDALENISERAADVAIRAQNAPSPGLWGHKLVTLDYAYWGAEALFQSWRDALYPPDPAAAVPYLDSTAGAQSIQPVIRQVFPEARLAVVCNGLDALLPMMRAGLGFGQLPSLLARTEPTLRRLDAVPVARTRTLWALTHPDLRDAPRFRVFMDFLKDAFATTDAA